MKTSRRVSPFIRQFSGPKQGSGIVCFKFWQAVVAGGCSYKCAYCFLQTVPWYRFRPDELTGLLYENISGIQNELSNWLREESPRTLISGELQEGLAFDDDYYKMVGTPLTHLIIPQFSQQDKHEVIFLTKSVEINHALELEATEQAIFSWSVNCSTVSKLWEHGAPSPRQRFEAARRMRDAGWRVRFRLDPMIPIEGWDHEYGRVLDEIMKIDPEMVTLGALRATNAKSLRKAAEKNDRATGVFDYLSGEKDPSGFKFRIDPIKQYQMFSFAHDALKDHTVVSLCKEHTSLWKKLGLDYGGCNCMPMKRTEVEMKASSSQMAIEAIQ